MKRVLALTLVLVLAIAVSGCGQPAADTGDTGDAEKIRVGLVYDVGGRGDMSFNDMAYAGLEQASKEFDIAITDVEPTGGGEDREEQLRLLAEQGYDLIFGVGFMFAEPLGRVAANFPEIKFGLIDGFIGDLTEESNVVCLLFNEHEGSFLVGAAAGLMTETDVVGFVGGMEIDLIKKFEAGFIAGAKYVNPDVEVLSNYIGTDSNAFKNPTVGRELTLQQIQNGADIVYHASGASGTGVISAAAEQGKLAIGVDADQSLTMPDHAANILTSMMKRVDVAVYDTIKAFVDGEYAGGYGSFGAANDGVGYAVNEHNEDMIAPVVDQLEELKAKIVAGEIVVPDTMDALETFLSGLGQ